MGVGDSITNQFSCLCNPKIETGERKFNIRIDEYAGMDLAPEIVTFPTLAVVPPNLVIADFAIDNEFGHHYIPKNETTTLTVRFQNLSIGKTDTAVLAFRRGQGFINDPDEVKTLVLYLVETGSIIVLRFLQEDRFTVFFDTYDYFDVKNNSDPFRNFKTL